MRAEQLTSVTASIVLSLGVGVSLARRPAAVSPGAPTPAAGGLSSSTSAPASAPAAAPEPSAGWVRRSLRPVASPDPDAEPQPRRSRPYRVAATADGTKAYVTLSGKEIAPGSEVAVIDVPGRRELRRVVVGTYPYGIRLHPSGRWVVVTNRYSSFLSVIDAATDQVLSEIPVLPYCEEVELSPDGRTAYLANFWKNQVLVVDLEELDGKLTGRMRSLGFDRAAFADRSAPERVEASLCEACGWRGEPAARCARCGKPAPEKVTGTVVRTRRGSIHAILRARCGSSDCHLYGLGGFTASPDAEDTFRSARAHAFPGAPDASPLLRCATSIRAGGWAEGVDGKHHPGGVVFEKGKDDPDFRRLRDWIASGVEGPGIPVGDKPRDMAVSADGATLYVANTGSLDVSVVDLRGLRETRRIFTRSPVNDIAWAGDRLVFATLGVGSGHPKARDAAREALDPSGPETDLTLKRDFATGKPLPPEEQRPLGPYDDVDGTAQEKFRDISNDLVLLDPSVSDVAAYAATDLWVRYTSDSFESLPGDAKGDVPPELMAVAGAFPEQVAAAGGRLYVTLSGTFQVQEWTRAGDRLAPGRVFETGLKPSGIAAAGRTLVVANHLDESVSFIDLATGASSALSLSRLPEPFPSTDFERGELLVQTAVFSVDQDQSCVHCHFRDASDGKKWSVSQVMGQSRGGEERTGGSREVPDMRGLFHDVPFFVEGTLTMDEPLTMLMEQNPLVDFQGVTPAGDFTGIFAAPEEEARYSVSADAIVVATGRWVAGGARLADLMKRREVHFARLSRRYLGGEYSLRDCQRFIGAYQGEEPRLLANPEDPEDPAIVEGKALFESPRVGCSRCHPPPAFTDKVHAYNANRSFPPLVTAAPRDDAHTLVSADRLDAINGFVRYWDPGDQGRVEEHEGYFVVPSLRGLWARPPRLLHHGRAVSLREVVCTPGHPALRPLASGRWEQGLNERDGVPDTHGATSHLTVWEVECLLRYLRSIE
ncbi:MAG: hypothetical protein HY721_09360 [Planctomycetes bacterium]|nr:hypothetical protein [Planctomycetota bacterium]